MSDGRSFAGRASVHFGWPQQCPLLCALAYCSALTSHEFSIFLKISNNKLPFGGRLLFLQVLHNARLTSENRAGPNWIFGYGKFERALTEISIFFSFFILSPLDCQEIIYYESYYLNNIFNQ